MSKRSIFAKSAAAVVAGAMAISAGAPVLAQTAVPSGAAAPSAAPSYSGYDPCQRDANGRGVGGALLGGGLGAVMGSQVAARGHRTDGSVLGGIVGAIAGAAIGHSTAACGTVPPPTRTAYYDAPPPPPPPPPAYGEQPYADGYGYGHRHYREDYAPPVGPDGCTLAESPIHMPDGSTQRRFVKVCLDRYGQYQVVN